ncbi:MAG TPA: dienelactone hydrolase family protein [Devosiaceae bacterium]
MGNHGKPDNQSRPVITQEMIDLYDDFTHRSFDRRQFMERLAALAGSASAATAAAAMMAASAQAAGMVAEDDARLTARTVSFGGGSGPMSGYLVMPAERSGPLPGVIVVHENRGLVPHIRDVARRVALEGFVALAPDFLTPLGGTPADEDAARPMFGQLVREDVAANGIAAIEWLRSQPETNGRIGATGFCWGGGTVNAMATHSPDLLAAVPYYGGQPPADEVPKIRARMMLHYAGLDERINAGIPDFKAALDAAGIDYQMFVYEGVNHAFNNDTSEARYDKAAAELAWSRTVAFFKETLTG